MKRALQILGAALVFVVAGAGSIWILRPEWVLSAGHKSLEIAPTVAAEHMAAAQQRNAKIRTKLHSLGAAQDRSIYGDKTAPGIQNNLFDEIAEDYDRIDFSKSPVPPDFNDILVYVLSGGENQTSCKSSLMTLAHRTPRWILQKAFSAMSMEKARRVWST